MKAVIFDLDGTLLYTLEDLADALNKTLECYHFPKLSLEKVESLLGDGIYKLIEGAVPTNDESLRAEILEKYRMEYQANSATKSHPYDGILEMLENLSNHGVKLAVLSNKPHKDTVFLVEHYFHNYITVVYGQRGGIPIKPDPTAVFEILKELEVLPEETVYVGDSPGDIEVAKAANILPVGVSWGYRPADLLEKHGASFIANNAEALTKRLLAN